MRDDPLLMFPSYLGHSIDGNMNDGQAISASFDVMFSAFSEGLSKPL